MKSVLTQEIVKLCIFPNNLCPWTFTGVKYLIKIYRYIRISNQTDHQTLAALVT